MGLRPTVSYLQVFSARRETSLSIWGVPHILLAPVKDPSLPSSSQKAVMGLITHTFHGIFRIIDNLNITCSNHSHCVFRYLDAVDSYTQISLFHRTQDYWSFQGLIAAPPVYPNLDSATLLTLAFYCSCQSTAAFTCDNLSTVSLLSPTGIRYISHLI